LVRQDPASPVARLVGGNRSGFRPAAIRVFIEVVARRGRFVHPRQVDPRLQWRRSIPATGRCSHGNGEEDNCKRTGLVHHYSLISIFGPSCCTTSATRATALRASSKNASPSPAR